MENLELRCQKSPCPRCGTALDGIIAIDPVTRGPRPGDATICVYCACWAVFDKDLALQPAPADLVQFLENEPQYQQIKEDVLEHIAIRTAQRYRPRTLDGN